MTDIEIGKYIVIAFAVLIVFIFLRGIKLILRLFFFVFVVAAIFIVWTRFQAG